MFNLVNLVGIIKEVNKDERSLKIEIKRYERFLDEKDQSTTFTISLPENLSPVYQQPILLGKVVGIKGYLALDSSGAIKVIGERIIRFENARKEND